MQNKVETTAWGKRTQVKKLNLLDHINFFPSKEEGRIPGGRKVLSERKTKPVGVQGKSLVPTV